MMPSISALIFSADCVKETLESLLSVYDFFDEVVVIYSAPDEGYEMFLKSVQDLNLKKVKIYRTIKISLPEPFKNYALSKCSGDFVMVIDTDERISNGLKQSIRYILSKSPLEISAFSVRRNECVTFDSKIRNRGFHIWWQTRIYRRQCVSWKGFSHERPTVLGKTVKIKDPDIYIDHIALLQHGRHLEYNNFDIVYPGFLPVIFFRDVVIGALMGRIKIVESYKRYRYISKRRTNEFRKISRIIKKIGVSKYLGLEKDDVIEELNKRYGNSEGGIELLLNLLLERFLGKYNLLDNLDKYDN